MSEDEKLEVFSLAPDGWLTISIPLLIPRGEMLALGRLRKAEDLVLRYFDRLRRLEAQQRAGLEKPLENPMLRPAP